MNGLGLLVGKELREQVRTLRLPVIVILFAILGMISPVFARYIKEIISAVGGDQLTGIVPDPVVGDAAVQFTKNLGQFGVLAAILVTMGSVAGEKDHGTAAFLLTKPVTRGAFLGAKVIAIGALLALATAVAGVLCWVYTAILFEPLPAGGFLAPSSWCGCRWRCSRPSPSWPRSWHARPSWPAASASPPCWWPASSRPSRSWAPTCRRDSGAPRTHWPWAPSRTRCWARSW